MLILMRGSMTPVTILTLAGLKKIFCRKTDRVYFGLAGTKLKPIFEGKFIYYKHEISPKELYIITDRVPVY